MPEKRSSQRSMFEVDHMFLDFVGPDTFYDFLARHRHELFRYEDLGIFNFLDKGRRIVPPSLLAKSFARQDFSIYPYERLRIRSNSLPQYDDTVKRKGSSVDSTEEPSTEKEAKGIRF